MKLSEKQLYFFGAVILLITAFFSEGYHHFDEHFQILEFAGLKMGLTEKENLPWEYHNQMRSAFQPAIVFVFSRLLAVFNLDSPFTLAFILRMLSGALSFLSIHIIYQEYKHHIKEEHYQKLILALSFFLWFLIYQNVRFSSENWSGTLFLIAFALSIKKGSSTKLHYLLLGILLGFSFLIRFQSAVLIAGLILWLYFIKKDSLQNLLTSVMGILMIIGIGVLMDRWFYEEWTFSVYNYIKIFFENDHAGFSIDPWWHYIGEIFIQGIPPFSIVFILATLIIFIFKPKSAITWSVLPFLLVHSLIGHKELRFLFPVFSLLPLILIESLQLVEEKWSKKIYEIKSVRIFVWLFFIVNAILLIPVCLRPADSQISLYKTIYDKYNKPVTLYYTDQNPYLRVLDINFYKKPELTIKEIGNIEDIENGMLYVSKMPLENPSGFRLIYSTYPEYIKKFNYNNWLSRANTWYIYKKTQKP